MNVDLMHRLKDVVQLYKNMKIKNQIIWDMVEKIQQDEVEIEKIMNEILEKVGEIK